MGYVDGVHLHGQRSEMGMFDDLDGGSPPLPVQAPGLVMRSGVTKRQNNAIVRSALQSFFPVRRAQAKFKRFDSMLNLLEIYTF